MKKITFGMLVLAAIVAMMFIQPVKAAPIDGMIGNSIPQFRAYVPFVQDVTTCKIDNTLVTVMARTFIYNPSSSEPTSVIRKDLFINTVIIGHYLPGVEAFFLMKDDKVVQVDKGVKVWGSPADQCKAAWRYISNE